MGGTTRRLGNAAPIGEANVVHDPRAAQNVVTAAWNAPPLLVGLDVTHQATFSAHEFELIGEHRNDAATFLDGPLDFYRRFGSTFTAPDTPCHDLLAVMAAAYPDVISDAPLLPLAVDCGGGAAWGTTVVDLRAPYFAARDGSHQQSAAGFATWRIALQADVAQFRERVCRLFGGAQH
jgi:purine nucleosidase